MDRIIYITEESTLRRIIREELERIVKPEPVEFSENERMSRRQAAAFMGCSYQTMYNYTKQGIVKEHGTLNKKFYLRSELINVLKNNL